MSYLLPRNLLSHVHDPRVNLECQYRLDKEAATQHPGTEHEHLTSAFDNWTDQRRYMSELFSWDKGGIHSVDPKVGPWTNKNENLGRQT